MDSYFDVSTVSRYAPGLAAVQVGVVGFLLCAGWVGQKNLAGH